MMVSAYGLGAVAQANPDAGTYYDINCPNSCYVLGNVLDTAILGAKCWPCHNVCPVGTVWDNAAQACSGSPVTPNAEVPVTQLPDCPSGSSWDAQLSKCVAPGADFLPTLQGYLPWILGGVVLLAIVPSFMGRR